MTEENLELEGFSPGPEQTKLKTALEISEWNFVKLVVYKRTDREGEFRLLHGYAAGLAYAIASRLIETPGTDALFVSAVWGKREREKLLFLVRAFVLELLAEGSVVTETFDEENLEIKLPDSEGSSLRTVSSNSCRTTKGWGGNLVILDRLDQSDDPEIAKIWVEETVKPLLELTTTRVVVLSGRSMKGSREIL